MAYALIMTPGCLKKLQSVCLFAGTFIYTDNQINSDPIYIRICDKSAISLIMNSFKRMTVTLLIGVVAIICLIISSVEKKKIELPIPLEFPFTDSDTFSGITINVLNQLIGGYIGVIAFLETGIIICILNDAVGATSFAICYSLRKFIDFIKSTRRIKGAAVIIDFRYILVQVQDFNQFVIWIRFS